MSLILGIETSCDDTSVALVRDGEVASVLVSSQAVHQNWGGIVPELASRAHLENIALVLERALEDAGVTIADVDAVAATHRPGLIGSLLVGLNVAKGIAVARNLPFFAVDHLEAHLLSVLIENDSSFPFLALLVSGGHTMIYDVTGIGEYRLIGVTRDDAAGEAFDKGSKLLGLGYPGGPIIDRLARDGKRTAVDFPRALSKKETYDFSFSGVKTALRYYLRDRYEGKEIPEGDLPDICASYQEAIVDALLRKTKLAAEDLQRERVALVGGVSANSRIRELFQEWTEGSGRTLLTTSAIYATDNAAMIANVGWYRSRDNDVDPLSTTARSSLPDVREWKKSRGRSGARR